MRWRPPGDCGEDGRGPVPAQNGGGGFQGCPCGCDVVDQNHTLPAEGRTRTEPEGALQIGQPLRAPKRRLWRSSSVPRQSEADGQVELTCHGNGDPLALVVPTREPAPPMEWHGNDDIGFGQDLPPVLSHRRSKVVAQIIEAPELQALNDGIKGVLVAPERKESIERGRLAEAGVAAPTLERDSWQRLGTDRAAGGRWPEPPAATGAEPEVVSSHRKRVPAREARSR